MKTEIFNPIDLVEKLDEMCFHSITTFNSEHVGVFWSEQGGPGPWEMHPDREELLHILEGEVEIEILPQDGSCGVKSNIVIGSFIVVPKGCWHRQNMIKRTKELYLSPQRTEHSNELDPRVGKLQ